MAIITSFSDNALWRGQLVEVTVVGLLTVVGLHILCAKGFADAVPDAVQQRDPLSRGLDAPVAGRNIRLGEGAELFFLAWCDLPQPPQVLVGRLSFASSRS